ncbi:MAG: hypothetical protein WA823_16470 [Candidatus Acidiferrales bacterium]
MRHFHSKAHYLYLRDRELRDAQHIEEIILPCMKGDPEEVIWTQHVFDHRKQAAEYERRAAECPE